MASTRFILTVAIVLMAAIGCHGYGYGVPETACDSMFPLGHFKDAQNTPAPFEMLVNATTYTPGTVIEVQLNAKNDTKQPDGRDWFYEGAFVQARTFDCSASRQTAQGTFSVVNGEDFMQPIKCHEIDNSAIRHYDHIYISKKTFYWTAPAQAVGHVIFRATVARNHDLFWVDVYSPVITDASSNVTTNLTPCEPRRLHNKYEFCPEQPTDGAVTTTSGAVSFILAVATALFLR